MSHGPCIGGPMDGQKLEHTTETFYVAIHPPVNLSPGTIAHTDIPVRKERYTFRSIHGHYGFWVHEDLTTNEAIAQIIGRSSYA
jgi:hypothetical protein